MIVRDLTIAMFVAAAAALSAPRSALAIEEGKTSQGEPFASGGIGAGERDVLDQRRKEFSLWVTTAAKGSGAYLAGTHVKIIDHAGKVVLDTKLEGPWLLVNLQAGEYTVEAIHLEQWLRQKVKIRPGDNHRTVFYFDVPAEVLPSTEKR